MGGGSGGIGWRRIECVNLHDLVWGRQGGGLEGNLGALLEQGHGR